MTSILIPHKFFSNAVMVMLLGIYTINGIVRLTTEGRLPLIHSDTIDDIRMPTRVEVSPHNALNDTVVIHISVSQVVFV